MLVETESGLKALFNNATIAIMVVDGDGNINLINPAAENLFGYSQDELMGGPLETLLAANLTDGPFSSSGRPFGYQEKFLLKKSIELTINRKNGSVFPAEVELSHYSLDAEKFTVLFVKDTTEEQISRDRFATIFYKSPATKIYAESDTGIIIDLNDNFSRFSGYTREDLIGRTLVELGAISALTQQKWQKALMGSGKVSDLEIEFCTKEGHQAYALLSAEQIELSGMKYLLSTCIDITEKKHAMEALKASEARLAKETKMLSELNDAGSRLWRVASLQQGLLEILSYTTGLFDTEMGNIHLFDADRQTLTIVAHKGLLKKFADYFCEARVGDGTACSRALQNKQQVIIEDVETDVLFAPHIPLAREAGFRSVSSTPLFAQDGSAIGTISVYKGNNGSFDLFDLQVMDLYALKVESFIESWKARETLGKLNSELERKVQERTLELTEMLKKEKDLNEMKSQFVSMAAHEFRTPLTTVLSSIDLIQLYYNRDEHTEKRNEHLAKTRTSIKQLTNILEDFLSLSKLEEGKVMTVPEQFNLFEFAEETIAEVNGMLKKGQNILLQCNSKETIFHDHKVLKNVMLNLLSNAIKYSEEGKEIIVGINIVYGTVAMQIIDRGIGIPDEDQDKLFGKYFRAGNASTIQGTGLGLNIVKRYLELMNGTISFASKYNEGTTFTITFPQRLS